MRAYAYAFALQPTKNAPRFQLGVVADLSAFRIDGFARHILRQVGNRRYVVEQLRVYTLA